MTRPRRRDSSEWDDLTHLAACAIGIAVSCILFVAGLAGLLSLTVAILGHPAADGAKAWFVLGPGLIIGAGGVFGGGRRAYTMSQAGLDNRLKRWRARGYAVCASKPDPDSAAEAEDISVATASSSEISVGSPENGTQ
jgi:hypothetical protein